METFGPSNFTYENVGIMNFEITPSFDDAASTEAIRYL